MLQRSVGFIAGLAGTALVTVAGLPASAGGATQLGNAFPPPDFNGGCNPGITALQSTSPGAAYTVPGPGVITAWSHHADAESPIQVAKLKVGRPVGLNVFHIVGESPLRSIVGGQLNTFTDVRIPVRPGDVIGMYPVGPPTSACANTLAGGYNIHSAAGDPPFDTTVAFDPDPAIQIDVAARLEADADNDGFGDETQDLCPSNATTQGACPASPSDTAPPQTTITQGAPKQSDSGKAKFTFASDEASSTFDCRLKGKSLKAAVKKFAPCVSPKKYKELDAGKYKFFVAAKDAANNVDPTPATAMFRIVE